ncbi:MAG: MBL fold metallo-hydrolase [Clostridiales bacterium]|nr:MBL fold metallo-hydrolase [Clostridiales bacterium]
MDDITYDVKQLDESCWQITEGAAGTINVCCFLVVGKEKAMLVDSCFGRGDLRGTVEKLTSLPVTLVNTHADGDHVLGNKLFGPAHMHPSDFDRYYDTVKYAAPVVSLWEGDVIDLGGRRFEVVLIPGHTPGSIALLDEENRVIFGGDSVQNGLVFMTGPGRNIAGYIDSLGKLIGMRSRFDKVFGGHGDAIVDSAILDELIACAEKVRSGELKGEAPPAAFAELGAEVYSFGKVKLLYS